MYMDSQSLSLLAWCPYTSTFGVPGLLALPVAVAELARLDWGEGLWAFTPCCLGLTHRLIVYSFYIHAFLILFILFA
ncbi:hypothetical protein Syun_019020 [Stephania yunnanensis]|uniref:Uncharacterized protein n=1 Tax=Stephania yunnanensis TaxID=152371 RepID=A0AAP0NWB4_9MAGN